jgi:hypothetical protein
MIYIPQMSVINPFKKKVLVYFCAGEYPTAKDKRAHKPTLMHFTEYESKLVERTLSVMVKRYIKAYTQSDHKDNTYVIKPGTL